MIITFLRHGSLLPPFDDYNSLSLEELTALARQKVDPSIDTAKVSSKLEGSNYITSKYDTLFVSQSRRTQDTANELKKRIDLPDFLVLKELNEILFDPSQLVSDEEYKKDKLVAIRKKLFKSLANNSNIEPGEEVVRRVMLLDSRLQATNAQSVLVITHGFFMRYLDIFYRQKSKKFNEEALNEAVNYDYISGFTVITN